MLGLRGCGFRQEGGIYLTVALSPFGSPLEHFLLCPPEPAPPDLPRQGMKYYEISAVVGYILDWVGEQYYPHVADFLEESRWMGFSRRIPRTFDFEALRGKHIYYLPVHRRAIVRFSAGFRPATREELGMNWRYECPAGTKHGEGEFCIRHWWSDYTPGDLVELQPRIGKRVFPPNGGNTVFVAGYDELPASCESGGIIACLRVSGFDVIIARDGSHEEALRRASQSGLPVNLTEY